MEYEVLSPWAQVDKLESGVMQPRPSDLDGKTIGLWAHFKEHSPLMLQEVERQLKEKYPTADFIHYQYPVDTSEIMSDEKYKPSFMEWLDKVDCVISAYGDAGSCAMFVAYNTAAMEILGKPTVMLVKEDLMHPSQRGASARQVPGLRFVPAQMPDLSMLFSLDGVAETILRPGVAEVLDELVTALTTPLTDEEKAPKKVEDLSGFVFKGSLGEVNNVFYQKGWTNGMPIIPPTREALEEMLTGTDLPRDHVVAKIPPMLGKATVEKIAVNAVMAGCLPTYLPILIAAVEGMVDPVIHLEGWTCSVSSWAPMMIVNGPIRRDISINGAGAVMSPYYKANATIAHALALIVMNISGVRPVLEDMSEMGHESRFGMCIGENEEASPWKGLHTDYGIDAEGSAVTLFWPSQRTSFYGKDAAGLLKNMCDIAILGWEPGSAFVISPGCAEILAKAGWSKKDVRSYLVEYARRPADELNVRWMIGNNHLPENCVPMPAETSRSVRKYWNDDHLLIIVGGSNYGASGVSYGGGGDHGGPVTKKLQLPKNWKALVEKYKDIVPTYVRY